MLEAKNLKKEIKDVLLNPPPLEKMLLDIKMTRVSLKQKGGDIGLFRTINKNLVEKIWKTLKMKALIKKNAQKLKELGFSETAARKHVRLLLKEVDNHINLENNHPIEGFAEGGFLELEVLREKKKIRH